LDFEALECLENEQIAKLLHPIAELGKSDLSTTSTTDIEDQITGLPKMKAVNITYLAPLELYNTQKPYFSQLPCIAQLQQSNVVERTYPVDIYDISGKENLFKLDEAGFEFMQFPTKLSNWTDELVQSEYLPEVSALLKEYFSCEKVVIYNYNVKHVSSFQMYQSLRLASFEPITRMNLEKGRGGLQYSKCIAVSNERSKALDRA
jgi:hypothetical protein